MAEVSGRIIERFAANLAALLASAPAASVAASNGSGPGADASGPGAPGFRRRRRGVPPRSRIFSLPVRAYNSLRRVGIHTVDDLSARTEADLLAIENLGPQSVREIKERLAGIGRHLADQPGGAPGQPTGPLRRGADGAAADGARADGAEADGAQADAPRSTA